MDSDLIYKQLEKEYEDYKQLELKLKNQKELVSDLIKYYLYNGGNKNIDKFII